MASCSSDPEPDQFDQAFYYPLKKGVFQIYTIEETKYSTSSDPEELQYELMIAVVDSFLNAENAYTYVLHRSTRDNVVDEWTYLDTWSVTQNQLRTVVYEGTVPYVKISFPASVGRKWNGNAFNTLGVDEYEITSQGSYTLGAETFEDCLFITQEDNEDFIVYLDKRTEVYGHGVGLIYREVINLHYCTVNCSGLQQIENGIEYKQSLKEYGTL
jgi:hypothetical protein